MTAILLKWYEDVCILFKAWSFGSSYQRVDDFWFYFVRRCDLSSCYQTSIMVAFPSDLDPARMGSMETGAASGSLSDLANYTHNCGGDICDENLPSRPAMCVLSLSYVTIISPQRTSYLKLVPSHTQNLSVAFSPVQITSCTWIGLYSWFTKLVSIHLLPWCTASQLIVPQ